jgi:hypothetical protein
VLVVVLENPDRFAIRLTAQISCRTSVFFRSRNPNAPRTSTTTRTIPNFGIWVYKLFSYAAWVASSVTKSRIRIAVLLSATRILENRM